MVTRLIAGRSRNRSSIPKTKTKIFFNSVNAVNFLVVSMGIKRPGRETDRLHFEEPKNACTVPIPLCLPDVLMAH